MYTSTFSFTYNLEYSFEFLLIAFFFSMTLGFVILTLSYFIAIQNPETEKISGYECGFSSFQDARKLFNVQFYIVAILFLIFDLEVVYLFPWSVSLYSQGISGFFSMVFFLVLLTFGLIYEIIKKVFDFEHFK